MYSASTGCQPEPSSFRADEDLRPNNSLVFALGRVDFDGIVAAVDSSLLID
jgi:hypothetical protein